MRRLSLNHVRIAAVIGLAVVALSMHTPAAAQSNPPPDAAATAPASAGNAASGGTVNSMGDPKTNRAGIVNGDAPRQKIELSGADRKLMRELAQAHLAEIKMSGLATAISGNEAIRSYGEKMLEEHLTALDELRQLAVRAKVILPGGVEKEQAGILQKLALQAGPDFDRLYLEQAGMASHEQSHRLFQQASSRAESPVLKDYAARLLPVIGQHLQMAQQMKDNPAAAMNAVQSSVSAGQSTSVNAAPGSSSDQSNSSSGAKGGASIAGSAKGSGK